MRLSLAATLAAVVALTVGSAHAADPRPLTPYEGAGSWVSIYDTAAWAHPQRVVSRPPPPA